MKVVKLNSSDLNKSQEPSDSQLEESSLHEFLVGRLKEHQLWKPEMNLKGSISVELAHFEWHIPNDQFETVLANLEGIDTVREQLSLEGERLGYDLTLLEMVEEA